MQDDGRGYIRLLDRQIVEVVRCGDAQNAQQERLTQIAGRQAKASPTTIKSEQGQKCQKRKRGAALGKNQGIDRAQRLNARKAAGKGSSAEVGGNPPQERGGGDVKISADGMRSMGQVIGRAARGRIPPSLRLR